MGKDEDTTMGTLDLIVKKCWFSDRNTDILNMVVSPSVDSDNAGKISLSLSHCTSLYEKYINDSLKGGGNVKLCIDGGKYYIVYPNGYITNLPVQSSDYKSCDDYTSPASVNNHHFIGVVDDASFDNGILKFSGICANNLNNRFKCIYNSSEGNIKYRWEYIQKRVNTRNLFFIVSDDFSHYIWFDGIHLSFGGSDIWHKKIDKCEIEINIDSSKNKLINSFDELQKVIDRHTSVYGTAEKMDFGYNYNFHSELEEHLEHLCKNEDCRDKEFPQFSISEMDLADVLINIMATAGAHNWRLAEAVLARIDSSMNK